MTKDSAFWAIITDCLTEFHGFSPVLAERMVADEREAIASLSGAVRESMYHNEPWSVACELANNELDVEEHEAAYLAVLSKHDW